MKFSEMYPSLWLGQVDVPSPIVVTIKEVKREGVKGQSGTETKTIVKFTQDVKPWILNKGNGKRLVALYGDDSTAWIGKNIEIYTDPNVEFAGEVTGGLRLRAPSAAPRSTPSTNGHPDLWDIWDGQTLIKGKSTDDVREFLANTSVPIPQLKLKPAGTGREMYKPADQWGITVAVGGDDDNIPF